MREGRKLLIRTSDAGIVWDAMNKYRVITLAVFVLLLAACRRAPATPTPEPVPQLLPTPTLAVAVEASADLVQTPPEAPSEPFAPAAPEPVSFEGTFEGFLDGDGGSRAPVMLALTQQDATVTGTIAIGEGLFLDGGNCGATAVPAGTQVASGEVDPSTPTHLEAGASVMVQGLSITIDLDADMAADGQTLAAQATIDLPLLCGRDPVISGVLARTN